MTATPSPGLPHDAQLIAARDEWGPAEADAHFKQLGRKSAGEARYKVQGGNDVLKWALSEINGRRCWFAGSIDCESRAMLLRNLQIDHLIPQKSSVTYLRLALSCSTVQVGVFDAHDPSNLALICGPCNQERGKSTAWGPAIEQRLALSEARRDKVISKVLRWHRDAGIDDAAIRALGGADVRDDSTWEVLADVIARVVETRAGTHVSMHDIAEAESADFHIAVGPSSEVVDAWVESYEEMAADEARHERRYGDC